MSGHVNGRTSMSSQSPRFRTSLAAAMADYRTRMGTRIAVERQRKGLERHDLAHLSGVSPRQIQRLETGKTESPRRRTLEALAEVLKIPVEELQPPDPIKEEEALRGQLDRIEALLTALVEHAGLSVEAILADAELRAQASETSSAPASQVDAASSSPQGARP